MDAIFAPNRMFFLNDLDAGDQYRQKIIIFRRNVQIHYIKTIGLEQKSRKIVHFLLSTKDFPGFASLPVRRLPVRCPFENGRLANWQRLANKN